jgi:hypothetical protein
MNYRREIELTNVLDDQQHKVTHFLDDVGFDSTEQGEAMTATKADKFVMSSPRISMNTKTHKRVFFLFAPN